MATYWSFSPIGKYFLVPQKLEWVEVNQWLNVCMKSGLNGYQVHFP